MKIIQLISTQITLKKSQDSESKKDSEIKNLKENLSEVTKQVLYIRDAMTKNNLINHEESLPNNLNHS